MVEVATAKATATVALEVVGKTAQTRVRDVVMSVVDMEAEVIVAVDLALNAAVKKRQRGDGSEGGSG